MITLICTLWTCFLNKWLSKNHYASFLIKCFFSYFSFYYFVSVFFRKSLVLEIPELPLCLSSCWVSSAIFIRSTSDLGLCLVILTKIDIFQNLRVGYIIKAQLVNHHQFYINFQEPVQIDHEYTQVEESHRWIWDFKNKSLQAGL